MLNQKAKEDKVASVIMRTILLLCAYLECILHVEHQPWVSDWGSKLAKRLSRRCTTSPQDQRLLQNWSRLKKIPPCLVEWLSQPRLDWGLANRVLSYVVNSWFSCVAMSFEINFCPNLSCFGVILFGHQAVIMRPESAVLNRGEEYRNTCPA